MTWQAITVVIASVIMGLGLVQQVYAWPAGITEAQKDKILSATTEDDLTTEEVGIGEDRMYEFFDAYVPDTKEWKDLMDCGFVDKWGFEVLQCLEAKGHPVR
jgi:hypothetical protein